MTRQRKPDFVILGAMKAGTTQLYRWLEQHPDVWLPRVKEPNFFSRDRAWRNGVSDYYARFSQTPPGRRTGEASPEYLDPAWSLSVSTRIQQAAPEARLVAVLRDPVARMRSHYTHQVLRGKELRPFSAAVTPLDSPYVRRSCYGAALAGFSLWLQDGRLQVFDFHQLFDEETRDQEWARLLRHLGLPGMPCPAGVPVNRTADKHAFSPLMRALYGPLTLQISAMLPPRVLRLFKPILLRDPQSVAPLIQSKSDPLPPQTLALLASDGNILRSICPVATRWHVAHGLR